MTQPLKRPPEGAPEPGGIDTRDYAESAYATGDAKLPAVEPDPRDAAKIGASLDHLLGVRDRTIAALGDPVQRAKFGEARLRAAIEKLSRLIGDPRATGRGARGEEGGGLDDVQLQDTAPITRAAIRGAENVAALPGDALRAAREALAHPGAAAREALRSNLPRGPSVAEQRATRLSMIPKGLQGKMAPEDVDPYAYMGEPAGPSYSGRMSDAAVEAALSRPQEEDQALAPHVGKVAPIAAGMLIPAGYLEGLVPGVAATTRLGRLGEAAALPTATSAFTAFQAPREHKLEALAESGVTAAGLTAGGAALRSVSGAAANAMRNSGRGQVTGMGPYIRQLEESGLSPGPIPGMPVTGPPGPIPFIPRNRGLVGKRADASARELAALPIARRAGAAGNAMREPVESELITREAAALVEPEAIRGSADARFKAAFPDALAAEGDLPVPTDAALEALRGHLARKRAGGGDRATMAGEIQTKLGYKPPTPVEDARAAAMANLDAPPPADHMAVDDTIRDIAPADTIPASGSLNTIPGGRGAARHIRKPVPVEAGTAGAFGPPAASGRPTSIPAREAHDVKARLWELSDIGKKQGSSYDPYTDIAGPLMDSFRKAAPRMGAEDKALSSSKDEAAALDERLRANPRPAGLVDRANRLRKVERTEMGKNQLLPQQAAEVEQFYSLLHDEPLAGQKTPTEPPTAIQLAKRLSQLGGPNNAARAQRFEILRQALIDMAPAPAKAQIGLRFDHVKNLMIKHQLSFSPTGFLSRGGGEEGRSGAAIMLGLGDKLKTAIGARYAFPLARRASTMGGGLAPAAGLLYNNEEADRLRSGR